MMGKIKGPFAETYDRFVSRPSILPDGLSGLVRSIRARDIVEFACGTGTVAAGLSLEGYNVVGVDYSADMLKVARRKAKGYDTKTTFVLADISTIDLKLQFDLLLCLGNTIPYFCDSDELDRLLGNCLRHLRPSGRFICQQLNYDRILRDKPATFAINIDREIVRFKQYRYKKTLLDFIVTVVDGSHIPPRVTISKIVLRPWTRGELTAAAAKAGFVKIRAYQDYRKRRFSLKSNDLIMIAEKP